MSEANMWEYLQPKLKAEGLGVERITERLTDGVPDVVYVNKNAVTGWLELKYLPNYPKDLDVTPLLTYGQHGLQIAQAFWLGRWARRGGRAGVLLRVGSTDWWYWRARGEPSWTENIRTTWAQDNPDRRWRVTNEPWPWMSSLGQLWHPFNVAHIVEELCE